jgi:hypothetical protein
MRYDRARNQLRPAPQLHPRSGRRPPLPMRGHAPREAERPQFQRECCGRPVSAVDELIPPSGYAADKGGDQPRRPHNVGW